MPIPVAGSGGNCPKLEGRGRGGEFIVTTVSTPVAGSGGNCPKLEGEDSQHRSRHEEED